MALMIIFLEGQKVRQPNCICRTVQVLFDSTREAPLSKTPIPRMLMLPSLMRRTMEIWICW
ncbi:MAG TPA: hypothetical protein DCE81_04010 [Cytophagales bacterium]|nr:hypothetical protein [Cytophagales bacterium]